MDDQATLLSAAPRPVAAPADPFAFDIIPGDAVREILDASFPDLVEVARDAYLAHARGDAANPPSHFLRFADRPADRIIALPADLGAGAGIAGIKWISSWPENVGRGIPRASALLVLNRRDNGYPFCVMEGAAISAARTAASAVLGLEQLGQNRLPPRPRIGFVGCGPIARAIADMMIARGTIPARIQAFDRNPDDAQRLLPHGATAPAPSLEALVRENDVVVFATTAGTPHLSDAAWFAHAPLVLHISLRDIAPAIILGADNVVDDVDHCLQAQTSVHLAEQESGRRDFIRGTIADAVAGALAFDPARTLIYSPFGMGILDLAVGRHVHAVAQRTGRAIPVPGFFGERTRW